jgi:hypothetical protein
MFKKIESENLSGGTIMLEKKFAGFLLCLVVVLIFSATVVRGENILFIAALEDTFMPGDDALKAFIEGLGHTVTYFDDDENEEDTEIAAAAADLVFISESVSSGDIRTEITEIETPMVITEAWGFDEMGLTLGTGEGVNVETTEIEIVNPEHPLAAGLSGTVSVLNDITSERGTARFTSGRAGDDATVIARATLSDGVTYDVIWVYEKGATLAVAPEDGSGREAAEMRVCFGFDEQSFLAWNDNAYFLLEAAINYALGIKALPQAYGPKPADGATEVERDTFLKWRAGLYAETHDLYFGTNFDDVNDASRDNPMGVLVAENQDATTYQPADLLEYGQTYYWRVDEFNAPPDTAVYKGNVWSFTVLNYIVIDDFEDYKDYEPDRVFDTWIDGYLSTTNGSTIGYPNPDFANDGHFVETNIVNNGDRSMPYFYDNTTAGVSEATMTLDSINDWTTNDANTMSLWFRGHPKDLVEDPDGTLTINASGEDIWDTSDEFRYVYKQMTGPGSIVAKVESIEDTDEWAKAGVMIRQTLDADSKFAAVYITARTGCRFQGRLTPTTEATSDTDVATEEQLAITAPYWIKLERDASNQFSAFYSEDGANWVAMSWNPQNVAMPPNVYAGLAVTSHNPKAICEAVFSNVEITGTVASDVWSQQAIGVDMPSNDVASVYVVLNESAVVYNNDPGASQIDNWTQWNIDLQEFADLGVDLTNVTKLGIGFGERGNPQPGGAGLVFFDDIRLNLPALGQ